jgi:alcohol dehydrogenase class IV
MESFNFFFPTRIVFGNGKLATLGEETARLGKRALLVTYPSQSLKNTVDQAVELLRNNGVETVLFTDIEANPTHSQVNHGGQVARDAGCDVVIGLGGGSAIDTAKAIAVVASEGVDIWKIYEGQPITRPSLPLVAVPTTAGTGTEATFFTVISHRELKRKEGFARTQFYPALSIVDPLLTLSLPPYMTAATGLDTLSHAIEAYYCRASTPVVEALAARAIQLVSENLRRAVFNGKDIVARYNMMLANTLAGMAITQSDSCLAHVVGEAVGAVYNTGHGVSVAVSLPATMEYNCFAAMERMANIARWMGEDTFGLTTRETAMLAPGAVRTLIEDVGLPLGLAALGVKDVQEVMALMLRPGMDASSPRPANRADFELLMQACLSPAMSYWDLGGK